jgi:hypothetical protein
MVNSNKNVRFFGCVISIHIGYVNMSIVRHNTIFIAVVESIFQREIVQNKTKHLIVKEVKVLVFQRIYLNFLD